MTVTPANLATYLLDPTISTDANKSARAQYIIDQATTLCSAVVDPLPDGADAVVLDVVTRAWSNPSNAQSQSMPVGSVSYGAVSGGLWLTRQNRQTLRTLAGGGGAYTIDVTPAGAATNLPWWDVDSGVPVGGDWDVPA